MDTQPSPITHPERNISTGEVIIRRRAVLSDQASLYWPLLILGGLTSSTGDAPSGVESVRREEFKEELEKILDDERKQFVLKAVAELCER